MIKRSAGIPAQPYWLSHGYLPEGTKESQQGWKLGRVTRSDLYFDQNRKEEEMLKFLRYQIQKV